MYPGIRASESVKRAKSSVGCAVLQILLAEVPRPETDERSEAKHINHLCYNTGVVCIRIWRMANSNNNNNNVFRVRFGVLWRHRGPLLEIRKPWSLNLGSLVEEVEKVGAKNRIRSLLISPWKKSIQGGKRCVFRPVRNKVENDTGWKSWLRNRTVEKNLNRTPSRTAVRKPHPVPYR